MKAWSEELPNLVNTKWFWHTFITTHMAYVGQVREPWDVPTKLAVEAMQNIWDGASSQDYEIMTSTAIYQKVRGRFVLNHETNIYI
jgi:hypothetical protein